MNSGDMWQDGLWALFGVVLPLFLFLIIIFGKNRYTSSRSMKKVTEHKMTGSISGDLMDDLINNKPLGGVYLLPKGAILPFTSAEPIDDGSLESLEVLSDWHIGQEAIRFLLYALERDDWKREFSEWESTLEETLLIAKRAVERDKLRKSFRVIDGGLEDKVIPGDFNPPQEQDDGES